ncbi:MAG: winged helix-turn-helix domain-containing protein [Alphaproteobacteria bacterium]
MSDDDRLLGGSALDDHALQLFGAGEHSRGGKLGDVFDAYMLRLGHRGVYDDPIFNGADWIFDDQLPDHGVVPLHIYTSAADHGALFLAQMRQGAKTGLVCDERHLLEPIPEYGFAPSLELTEFIVENQKMIDRGMRDDWQFGERLELHHKAWFKHDGLFMTTLESRGRPVDLPDDAEPIVFKQAWELLTDVSIFRNLLGLASIAMAARVPRDGTGGRILLPIDTWDDGTIRLDFVRNLLFVPTYDQAKPWVARLEDIWLLNRALHPEWEPVHEITDPIPERLRDGGDVEVKSEPESGRGEKVVPSASAENAVQWGGLGPQIIEEYENILREDNPPITYASCAILIAKRINYKRGPELIARRLRKFREDGLIENIK